MKDFLKKMMGGGDDLQKMVEDAQRQAQMYQATQGQPMTVSDMMAQAAALTGADQEARTQFVKKTNCHNCGGAKTLAPKTAYVYCDFCGSLTDYDFQKACEISLSAVPDPAYVQFVQSLQADIEAAKRTSDPDTFRQIQKQIYTKWIELCPNAVSPRAKNDEEYRKQLVDYMAEAATINEFDPTQRQLTDQMIQQTRAIQWSGTFPRPTAAGGTFWPVYETVKQQTEHSFGLLRAAGLIERHPDQAPESLQRRMALSMFCQGWLPSLSEEDSERMIADAGLKGEYSKLEPKETTLRHCGQCGGDLHTLPGAKAVLCEDCGTRIDVSSAEVNCKNCGGEISFPLGKNRVTCPFCKAEAQRMGW